MKRGQGVGVDELAFEHSGVIDPRLVGQNAVGEDKTYARFVEGLELTTLEVVRLPPGPFHDGRHAALQHAEGAEMHQSLPFRATVRRRRIGAQGEDALHKPRVDDLVIAATSQSHLPEVLMGVNEPGHDDFAVGVDHLSSVIVKFHSNGDDSAIYKKHVGIFDLAKAPLVYVWLHARNQTASYEHAAVFIDWHVGWVIGRVVAKSGGERILWAPTSEKGGEGIADIHMGGRRDLALALPRTAAALERIAKRWETVGDIAVHPHRFTKSGKSNSREGKIFFSVALFLILDNSNESYNGAKKAIFFRRRAISDEFVRDRLRNSLP